MRKRIWERARQLDSAVTSVMMMREKVDCTGYHSELEYQRLGKWLNSEQDRTLNVIQNRNPTYSHEKESNCECKIVIWLK